MNRALLVLLFCAGCSCGAPRAEAPAPSAAPSAASYSVHEWGLVRSGPSDTTDVGAIGPHAPTMADIGVIEKPVLYFHLAGGDSLDVDVHVDAHDGEIREHWPLVDPASAPHAITWPGVHLHSSVCPLVDFADPTGPYCAHLDPGEACETRDLARALATNVACLGVATLDAPFLFYRVRTRSLTVPLSATATSSGDLEVRNDGELPLPGRLIRFQRVMDRIGAVVVDPPAPHASIVVGHDFGGPDVARAAVTASLTEIGLTREETSAFLTSWDEAFFGAAPTERARAVEEIPPAEHSILYFLPESEIDRLAQLELTPPPAEVHRAMAVWTLLAL